MIRYGIRDSVDQLWIGNRDGPYTYPLRLTARVAAMMWDYMMHQPHGRTKAAPFTGHQGLVDRVQPERSEAEAWRWFLGR
jgi:hypothetical protein